MIICQNIWGSGGLVDGELGLWSDGSQLILRADGSQQKFVYLIWNWTSCQKVIGSGCIFVMLVVGPLQEIFKLTRLDCVLLHHLLTGCTIVHQFVSHSLCKNPYKRTIQVIRDFIFQKSLMHTFRTIKLPSTTLSPVQINYKVNLYIFHGEVFLLLLLRSKCGTRWIQVSSSIS